MLLVDGPGLKLTTISVRLSWTTADTLLYHLNPRISSSQVLLVDRPGLKQTTIAVGEPGVDLKDPDAPALDVLTSVLNNFGGRLFNQIRSREVNSVNYSKRQSVSSERSDVPALDMLTCVPVVWRGAIRAVCAR